MLFNSLHFILFFPAVTLAYFLLPHKSRAFFLLAASCFFYMAFIPVYILILFLTIVIDYFAGIWIEGAQGKTRKNYLIISLVSNIGILAVFKYYNFFNESIAAAAHFLHIPYAIPALNIILPIGLSFHTFQAMSYTIEVYRGHQTAERNFIIYALYVMFYPQLVAGPIERPQNLLYQFYEEHHFDYQRVTDGLKLMAWGLFKKAVVADRLAVFVNQVYANPEAHTGLSLVLGTVFFAFQIYCDFSGYSETAIGAAQVMGFKLMKNFDSPYFSASVSEFWKRWHISLSTWFKDYLYIPLGGNRGTAGRVYFNLMITFLISGLWHGANWTYVAWGGLNGFYLLFALKSASFRARLAEKTGLARFPRLHHGLKVMTTFSLICFSWIFFRAVNFQDAFYIAGHLFSGLGETLTQPKLLQESLFLGQRPFDFYVAVAVLGFMLFVDYLRKHYSIRELVSAKIPSLRWGLYYGLMITILYFGKFGLDAQQFIYFQF